MNEPVGYPVKDDSHLGKYFDFLEFAFPDQETREDFWFRTKGDLMELGSSFTWLSTEPGSIDEYREILEYLDPEFIDVAYLRSHATIEYTLRFHDIPPRPVNMGKFIFVLVGLRKVNNEPNIRWQDYVLIG